MKWSDIRINTPFLVVVGIVLAGITGCMQEVRDIFPLGVQVVRERIVEKPYNISVAYSVSRMSDTDLKGYPRSRWYNGGWLAREWTDALNPQEERDLILFLQREEEASAADDSAANGILSIMEERLIGANDSDIWVSYFYKNAPGTVHFSEHEWLYLYVLDRSLEKLYYTTNAIR